MGLRGLPVGAAAVCRRLALALDGGRFSLPKALRGGVGTGVRGAIYTANGAKPGLVEVTLFALTLILVLRRPPETDGRASSSVSGKLVRTRSISCNAASTVRFSACQRRTRPIRSAAVFAAMALKG